MINSGYHDVAQSQVKYYQTYIVVIIPKSREIYIGIILKSTNMIDYRCQNRL